MKKVIAVLFSILPIMGCSEPIQQTQWVKSSTNMKDVPGFEDCIFAKIRTETTESEMRVIRCPLSTVSTKSVTGKTSKNNQVIDETENTKIAEIEKIIRNAQIELEKLKSMK